MSSDHKIFNTDGIEYSVIYSARRSIAINIHPDSTVKVRVPYRTSLKSIDLLVHQKAGWIIKHRNKFKKRDKCISDLKYVNGEVHLFRGNKVTLSIEKSKKPYITIDTDVIKLGLERTNDEVAVKKLLYKGYKHEALKVFQEILFKVIKMNEKQMFGPEKLVIRTMKRRWGSCSSKGVITLNTELIRLSDKYIEYVILHELCHLKHHNHGKYYYSLLSEVCPDYKETRKSLKDYVV
jgi:predicted metal-dependent hydrolase